MKYPPRAATHTRINIYTDAREYWKCSPTGRWRIYTAGRWDRHGVAIKPLNLERIDNG